MNKNGIALFINNDSKLDIIILLMKIIYRYL